MGMLGREGFKTLSEDPISVVSLTKIEKIAACFTEPGSDNTDDVVNAAVRRVEIDSADLEGRESSLVRSWETFARNAVVGEQPDCIEQVYIVRV